MKYYYNYIKKFVQKKPFPSQYIIHITHPYAKLTHSMSLPIRRVFFLDGEDDDGDVPEIEDMRGPQDMVPLGTYLV